MAAAKGLKAADGSKLHATQKPEELLKRIIVASSTPGDVVLDPFAGTGTTAAVAKQLRRHYIGIEQDAQYVAAAEARLAAVKPLLASDPLIQQALQPKPKRVPFRKLLELGLLQAGQRLYLDQPQESATILANGKLRVNGSQGSIHQLGAELKAAPSCNGWVHWHYKDEDGALQPIDVLREQVRALTNSG